MKQTNRILTAALFGLCTLVASREAAACTAFQLQARDGAWIYLRSMEFGFPFHSEVLIVPRGTEYTGTAPGGAPGLAWKSKYGLVGPNQSVATSLVADGMNERGLVVGMLLFPRYAQYGAADPAKNDRTLGSWEVASYLLSMCSSVDDARKALTDGSVYVANAEFTPFGMILPVHYYIADASGAVLIAEYVDGKLQLHDDAFGILTNSPDFVWQQTNLLNFVNLSPVNVPNAEVDGRRIEGFGQGSGALGLPGDFTPPSRFVRAALFSHWATPGATASDAVLAGFHVLNTFDIFAGAIRANSANLPASGEAFLDSKKPQIVNTDTTEWTLAHDRTNLRTYLRTYESLTIQMIDLKQIDFSQPGLRQIELDKAFNPVDVSTTAQPLGSDSK
jgi:choloylglycine hydrolase